MDNGCWSCLFTAVSTSSLSVWYFYASKLAVVTAEVIMLPGFLLLSYVQPQRNVSYAEQTWTEEILIPRINSFRELLKVGALERCLSQLKLS